MLTPPQGTPNVVQEILIKTTNILLTPKLVDNLLELIEQSVRSSSPTVPIFAAGPRFCWLAAKIVMSYLDTFSAITSSIFANPFPSNRLEATQIATVVSLFYYSVMVDQFSSCNCKCLDYFQIFSKWVGGVGKSETGLTILPFIHSTKGFIESNNSNTKFTSFIENMLNFSLVKVCVTLVNRNSTNWSLFPRTKMFAWNLESIKRFTFNFRLVPLHLKRRKSVTWWGSLQSVPLF